MLLSAQNRADWANDSSNDKTSIGASFNIGAQTGFTLDLGAQIAKGKGTGSSVTQVNSTIDTGSLVLESGNDTRLIGAQVRADRIKANIGGDLEITSLQDSETQRNKQSSGGVGASICVPPFCLGTPVAASANIAKSGLNSDYRAVTDQSGFYAGQGGYDIQVGKNTVLQGAVIASDAAASKNRLSTDRLITSDIKNISEIETHAVSASVSTSGNSLSPGMVFGLKLDDADKSVTRSAVSEGDIEVRSAQGGGDLVGLNRNTAHSNGALDKPDRDAIEERMELVRSSVALVKDLSSTIADARNKAAKDPNSEEAKEARQQLADAGNTDPTDTQISDQVQRNYGTGSSFQRAAQAASGVVQGILSGNFAGALAGGAAPYLAHSIKEMTAGDDNANLFAHVVLGAVVAQAQGNSALAGGTGAGLGELVARQLYPGKRSDQLTETERQTVSALSTLAGGLAGALTSDGDVNTIAGALAAKNAVENNHVSTIEDVTLRDLRKEYAEECVGGAASDACDRKNKKITELEEKAKSVLHEETIYLAEDMGRDRVITTVPGEIIPCAISGNNMCVVTDKVVTTGQGAEWELVPATAAEAVIGKERQAASEAATKASLEKVAADFFDSGCGGIGPSATACQMYMATSGMHPITGQPLSAAERVAYGLGAAASVAGASVAGVSAIRGQGVAVGEKAAAQAAADVGAKSTDAILGLNIGRFDLGDLLGRGGNKDVYAYGDNQAVGVLRNGTNSQAISDEIEMLGRLNDAGLPTVNPRAVSVDGSPGMLMDQFSQGSKDIVRLLDGKVRVVGDSKLLNQQSISDLQNIRATMVSNNIQISDLQFLISNEGRVVVADPLAVKFNAAPSKNNLRMIDLLIQSARKN